MTLHDVLLGLVGLLLVYVAWLLLCLVRSRLARQDSINRDFEESPPETIHSQILGGDPTLAYSSVSYDGRHSGEVRSEPKVIRAVEPDASEFGFDALLEMRTTRALLDEMQASHALLQAEVRDLAEKMTELRAASQVSPLYSEAVALARRGYDAQAIADRCGISVAEAELVFSLSGDSRTGGTDG